MHLDVLAAVQFQDNWLQVLQTTFMRHAFLGGSMVRSPPA